MKLVRFVFKFEVEDQEFKDIKKGLCPQKEETKKRQTRRHHIGPRKERNDIGKQRNEGDMTTQFYTQEICELIGCTRFTHRSVNGKIKSFNCLGEGMIRMPGRAYAGGYTSSEDTWNKFFAIFGK